MSTRPHGVTSKKTIFFGLVNIQYTHTVVVVVIFIIIITINI